MESNLHPVDLNRLVPRLGVNHHVGGLPASRSNLALLQSYYEAWFNLARDVMTWQSISTKSCIDRLRNLSSAIIENDSIDILNVCQSASQLLISNEITSYTCFKDKLYELHSVPLLTVERLLSPIAPVLVSLFECPDIKAMSLQPILNFLRFGKKLNFEAIGLEDKSILGYIETEKRLATVLIDPNSALIKGMNRIMRTWLRDLDLSNLIPSHGSGSVAEGSLTQYEKFCELKDDTYLRIVLGQFWREYYPCGSKGDLERISRTIFVPKTFSKLRTISMEPATLQYFQQGVMKKVYNFIGRHPYMGRRIKLRDQTQNQEYAQIGSMYNSLSTIDLSAASDSVSWSLVKAVFAGTPLLKWLYATRSKRTLLPNGSLLDLLKFAPMGSALCFPIQCMVFAALIEHVSQRWCYTSRRAKLDYSVYGDDMVVNRVITKDVVDALISIGFIVNDDKSYTDGPFRESCGKDYFEGIDVSSVYYRLPAYNVHKLSPDVYASLCSSANLAGERNFASLRRYYISILLLEKRTSPHFTNVAMLSPHLFSVCPTNYHVVARWNKDYQRWGGKFCSVKSKLRHQELPLNEPLGLFIKLSELADRRESNDFSSIRESGAGVALHGAYSYLGSTDYEVDRLDQVVAP